MELTEINTPPLPCKLDYESALALTLALADFERAIHDSEHSSFHLERMLLLSEYLGNPQDQVPTVHIAGTKGKGSTAAMVSSVLSKVGLKSGLATSPHLHSVTERIRVGLSPISKNSFISLTRELWPSVIKVETEGNFGGVSWFEFMISAAFKHFKNIGADIQVIETGLGGRLDATNIVRPVVTAITSISLDHTAILGESIPEIALEKAGIIKENVPIVVAPQQEELGAFEVISDRASNLNAPLIDVSNEYSATIKSSGIDGQLVQIRGISGMYEFHLPLLGIHQIENAMTAVAVVESLKESGYSISGSAVEQGLNEVKWAGRLEVIDSKGPLVVVDGAHNPYSSSSLAKSLGHSVIPHVSPQAQIFLVFGALRTHDVVEMLRVLSHLKPTLIPVSSRHPRSISHKQILRAASEADPSGDICRAKGFGTVKEGLEYAVSISSEDDILLITGSLSVVAEGIEWKRGVEPELYPSLPARPK